LRNRRRDLKKLIAAARYWARSLTGSHKGKDQRADDLRAFGAPDSVIRRMERSQSKQREGFHVLRANWDVIRVFMQLQTQWHRAGANGVMTGIDYSALEIVTRALDVDLNAELLGKIQRMEFAVLEELATA
jgi:hypothetical protein